MTTTDELSRDTRAHTSGPGSQLTAANRSIQIDGDSLIYRRFGNEQTDAPPLSASSTSAATSTAGTRRWSTGSPRIAKSSCSTTAASAARPESFPTT